MSESWTDTNGVTHLPDCWACRPDGCCCFDDCATMNTEWIEIQPGITIEIPVDGVTRSIETTYPRQSAAAGVEFKGYATVQRPWSEEI